MLLKDIIAVARNARYLPSVFDPSESTSPKFRNTFSEDRFIPGAVVKATHLLKAGLAGHGKRDLSGADVYSIGEYPDSNEVWIYVNGICTERALATFNAECLSFMFKSNITVVHNPTRGIVADLSESVFERTFDQTCTVSTDLYAEVLGALLDGKKVRVIGHSQGGIIANRMLRLACALETSLFGNLEVYTFASAADEHVNLEGVYQEHFANDEDFVSRVGILDLGQKADVYVREGVGHLLNRDYLEHLATGRFCGKKSRLYQLVSL